MRVLRGSTIAAVLFTTLLMSLMLPGRVLADMDDVGEVVVDVEKFDLYLGYTDLDIDGGGQTVRPFGTLEPHAVFGGTYFNPLEAGLLDLSLKYDTEHYYGFEGSFDGDAMSLDVEAGRFIRNLVHDNLPLASDTSAAPLYVPDDLNPGAGYGVDIGEQSVRLNYKVPNYPAHLKVSARQYTMEGEKQQVFLDEGYPGSGSCASCHNVSRTRKIKTSIQQIGVGADAHLGYFDVSYQFRSTMFEDDMPDPVFTFSAIASPFATFRAAGPYPHNTNPDITSQEHTLNISTNITGRWAGGLGLGFGERENEDSDLAEEYENARTYVVWRPSDRVVMSADTLQTLRQDDPPSAGSAVAVARSTDGLPLEYGSLRTRTRASVTYYPVRGIKVRGMVGKEKIEREDEENWGLPDETTSDLWSLTSRIRLSGGWLFRAGLESRDTSDPQYFTTPTDSTKTSVGAEWRPRTNVTLMADWKSICSENSRNGRDSEKMFVNSGITYSPTPPVSLSLFYFRFEDDVDTDLAYDGPSATIVTDPDVPYRANGDQYLVRLAWAAAENLSLEGNLSYLNAEGSYDAGDPAFDDIDLYSSLDVQQVESSIGVRYSFRQDWDLSLSLARLEYEDRGAQTTDETIDEVGAVVSRRW